MNDWDSLPTRPSATIRKRIINLTGRFRKETRGAIAIMTALSLPVVVGFIGMGVEAGLWFHAKRDLQTAADSAAVAAAYEVARGYPDAVMTQTGENAAANNGYDGSKNDAITINSPPLSGDFNGNNEAVQVIMTRNLSLLFTDIFMDGGVTISVQAVAILDGGDDFCILGLHPTASGGVSVGGTADVELDCGVASNSNADDAFQVFGNADVAASNASTVGGIEVSGGGSLVTSEPSRQNALPARDPYADLAEPSVGSCDYPSVTRVQNGDNTTLFPGVYCGDIRITGGTATFSPGEYILKGADIMITGGTIFGTDTFFFFTNDGPNFGQIDVTGGDIDLTAPDSGDYAGMLFFQDRDAPTGMGASTTNRINGGSSFSMTGALYFPSQKIDFAGGANAGGCTVLVGSVVEFTGNSDLQINCAGTGVELPTTTIVRLAG
jgi:hypothetical protein